MGGRDLVLGGRDRSSFAEAMAISPAAASIRQLSRLGVPDTGKPRPRSFERQSYQLKPPQHFRSS